MKLSEIIREYVDAKIEGEPKASEWSSIDASFEAKRNYHAHLAELEEAIDAAVKAAGKPVDPEPAQEQAQ